MEKLLRILMGTDDFEWEGKVNYNKLTHKQTKLASFINWPFFFAHSLSGNVISYIIFSPNAVAVTVNAVTQPFTFFLIIVYSNPLVANVMRLWTNFLFFYFSS